MTRLFLYKTPLQPAETSVAATASGPEVSDPTHEQARESLFGGTSLDRQDLNTQVVEHWRQQLEVMKGLLEESALGQQQLQEMRDDLARFAEAKGNELRPQLESLKEKMKKLAEMAEEEKRQVEQFLVEMEAEVLEVMEKIKASVNEYFKRHPEKIQEYKQAEANQDTRTTQQIIAEAIQSASQYTSSSMSQIEAKLSSWGGRVKNYFKSGAEQPTDQGKEGYAFLDRWGAHWEDWGNRSGDYFSARAERIESGDFGQELYGGIAGISFGIFLKYYIDGNFDGGVKAAIWGGVMGALLDKEILSGTVEVIGAVEGGIWDALGVFGALINNPGKALNEFHREDGSFDFDRYLKYTKTGLTAEQRANGERALLSPERNLSLGGILQTLAWLWVNVLMISGGIKGVKGLKKKAAENAAKANAKAKERLGLLAKNQENHETHLAKVAKNLESPPLFRDAWNPLLGFYKGKILSSNEKNKIQSKIKSLSKDDQKKLLKALRTGVRFSAGVVPAREQFWNIQEVKDLGVSEEPSFARELKRKQEKAFSNISKYYEEANRKYAGDHSARWKVFLARSARSSVWRNLKTLGIDEEQLNLIKKKKKEEIAKETWKIVEDNYTAWETAFAPTTTSGTDGSAT